MGGIKMKSEKDIIEFFDKYKEQLLPEEKETFMTALKMNMERLPQPSNFKERDPEMSKEYAEWLLNKMKKDYRRQKREAVLTCVLVSVIVAALLLFLYGFGVFEISTTVTVVVLAAVAFIAVGFIANTIPSVIKYR